MKVLRLKQEADSLKDIEEVEKTIKQRFKKFSSRNISKSFFWGNKTKKINGKRHVTYSLAMYDTEDNKEVYQTLKDNFSELFEEQNYG